VKDRHDTVDRVKYFRLHLVLALLFCVTAPCPAWARPSQDPPHVGFVYLLNDLWEAVANLLFGRQLHVVTAEDLLAARISRASHGRANRYMRLDDDFCDTCVIDRNAAIANKMVYTIFEDASDAPVWARVPCLSAVPVPQNLRHFAPPGYFADRMINDNGKLPGRVPTSIKKRAGAFAVLFVPEAFAPDKPPILAFKGTVTLRDWRNNLFASPWHYVERLLHWDPACKEEGNKVSNLHTDLIYHVSQKGAVVVTGHSQGGGVAQVYGDWLDQHVELWLPETMLLVQSPLVGFMS
jgi:hypothetical protein